MAISGIIAEFNPLHKGHEHIINAAKSENNTVVCVISGNFVQRGDIAVIPKYKRAEAALRCGADLVAELPVPWSMSTAQNFALGGISQLMALGVQNIFFGSECGNTEKLKEAAEILEHPDFHSILSEELKTGISFAAARENTAKKLGLDSEIYSSPNDILGTEYISAAKMLGYTGNFTCIKRIGAQHDSNQINPNSVSASLIREKLKKGDLGFAERFMPANLRGFLKENFIADIHNLDTAIMAVLRMKTLQELACIPDLSEGIENKLYFSLKVAASFDELCGMIKTKRYSHARIRRLVLSAFLGLDSTFFKTQPPYVRILGFSEKGRIHLSSLTDSPVPVITRVSELKNSDEICKKLFDLECRATDIYYLATKKPQSCGNEYKNKLLKSEIL